MENKSSNLDLALKDTSNTKLLTRPGTEYLKSDFLKQRVKQLPLTKDPIDKLSHSEMSDSEYKTNFSTQDSDLIFSLAKKKRRKKLMNGNFPVWHGDIALKTNEELPVVKTNTESLPSTDETELTDSELKHEQTRMALKETPTNEQLISKMPDPNDDFHIQDLDFNMLRKKRRKKTGGDNLFVDDVQLKTDSCDLHTNVKEGDYNYEDLLSRIYSTISAKDPKSKLKTHQKTIIMKPPQVIRIGTKRTSFTNFLDFCKTFHRNPQHLHSYILAELATTASIDSNNQLIIKGRFEQRQIETVLRHYIKEYVLCHACHSSDTMLQKDSRLCFLQCESCGSRWSVASIKSGFQAVTSKRSAMRAKGN